MKNHANRRRFLKGMATLGASIYVLPVLAASKSAPAATLLLSEGVRDSQFAYGVAQVSRVEAKALAMFQPEAWQQVIQIHPRQRLIGLMDNASFAIFEALLANQNARFLVTGHHAQGHCFVTVPEAAGVASALNHHLSGNPEGYQLEEICRGLSSRKNASRPITVMRGKSDWACSLGRSYAAIANGSWKAGAPGNFSRERATMATAKEALVSFVVEV